MAEKTPGSDIRSFEDRVNQIIDRRLQDPTRLPSTYRAWLPKFIETQDIRLPISQVQGLYLAETTTTALGGDVHGRPGMVRAGTTPYDFTQVTFDAVYGKWVSPPFVLVAGHDAGGKAVTWTTYNDSYVSVTWWETFDLVGFTPQFKLACAIQGNASVTGHATLSFNSFDHGDTYAAGTTDSQWELTSTSATILVKQTTWLEMASPPTVKDMLYVGVATKKSGGGGGAAGIGWATVFVRWVADSTVS